MKCPSCGIKKKTEEDGLAGDLEALGVAVFCQPCTLLSEIRQILDFLMGKYEEPVWLNQDLLKRRKPV